MNRPPELFNTPFELGLRMVYLLFHLRPNGADLQKLVLLDYVIIYSGDLGGPESLHTPVPFRNGELFSRRERIEQGLYLMSTRGLVDVLFDASGMTYIAGNSSFTMIGSLSSAYWRKLADRCAWAASRYGESDSNTLLQEFGEGGHRWGAEFEMTKGAH
ncbi:hypothetical protein M2650_13155 [Luteimonas sp. SX5]|uniref:Threonine transporter RhtB n=1 Tax=Luteimonas galliterrae TaxID=2940486 RepID=A0ABT0ML28_9GAMM|nr:ABC-three component system middle component 2 [Luteimonas galliterrae]MCL1635570.1 hypothetical protein [Luteimonas galliterrae]